MYRCPRLSALALVLAFFASPASAWWDAGHMQIAYVAYKHLDDPVKDKVDALLRLNKDYDKWSAGARDDKTAKLYAFVHAATWPDDIKTSDYGYTNDKVQNPSAGQNIGYADHNQHAYWHFKDTHVSPDDTPLPPDAPVDLVTQLKLMIAALPAQSGASDDVRSYDLVWILHLVGDAHSRCTPSAVSPGRFRTATPAATPSSSFPRRVRRSRFMAIGTGCSADTSRPPVQSSTPTTRTASRTSRSTRLWHKLPIRKCGSMKARSSQSSTPMPRR